MNRLIIASLISFFLLLCACSPRNEREITGIYLYETLQEKETIILKGDNRYSRQYLQKQTNQSRQEIGTWNYEHNGGPHVYLEYCDSTEPPKCKGESKVIEKWFGQLYLGMNEDGAKLYRKAD